MSGATVGERLERSAAGRFAIVVGVTVVLLAEIGTHLPPSSLRRSVAPAASRVAQLSASEQTWSVFAPNPRSVSLTLEAEVTFADGSTATWELPSGSVIGANLRFYRWRKWLESARADAHWLLWDPTARWIASLYQNRGSPVVQVDLIRRFHQNVIDGPQPPWQAYTYHTLLLEQDG